MIAQSARSPAWLREIVGALGVSPQFVLEGNVRDRILVADEDGAPVLEFSLLDALWRALDGCGYAWLLAYDPVDGLRVHPDEPEHREAARAVLGRDLPAAGEPLSPEALSRVLTAVVHAEGPRIAMVLENASRLVPDAQHLAPDEYALFAAAERLSVTAVPEAAGSGAAVALYNPLLWLVDTERDLPPWLVTGNDGVRVVSLPLPDLGERKVVAGLLAAGFPDYAATGPEEQAEMIERFAQQTDGMTVRAMLGIATLAAAGELGMEGIEDAARCYRVGVLDNPWADPDRRQAIRDGDRVIRRRVIGQAGAVQRSLDILVRSATGLTGAHASPYASRPRGVLFFAGPTGVGKTELAKTLTQLVFGDENAYTRFDMSEFSEEHTAARLIGAPPGYTGHGAGGELTNAVRRRPFSLILFDEIEKADSRILDKFLQILEDGRLTDGQGSTVFFSETILVFTSNLGIYVEGPDGRLTANVTPEMDPPEAEHRIREAIGHHFRVKLGRPELLNRLGDNIVVFGFVDRESGEQILDLQLQNVVRRVERLYGATLTLRPEVRGALGTLALSDLSNGGRGIGSVVETALVNPLARALFADPPAAGASIEVTALRAGASGHEIELG